MTTQRVHPEGLLGIKIGMTQVFTPEGESVAATVIKAGPCYVLDVLANEKHGYEGVQLGFGPKNQARVNKADAGRFAKAGRGCFEYVKEIRCKAEELGWGTVGKEITVADLFNDGDVVDVSGTAVGKGFQGVVRRFKVKGQPATRGTHEYRRHIGSIGCRKFPGRVFKNKKMPGRMGNQAVTLQNIRVIGVNPQENLLIVKGGIPGGKGALVVIRKARKHAGVRAAV
jgi:large subunit ribosomal protein L3